MIGSKQLAFAFCLLPGMQASVFAQSRLDEPRGKRLYAEYRNACHARKIHWREQRLATDWKSLKALLLSNVIQLPFATYSNSPGGRHACQ